MSFTTDLFISYNDDINVKQEKISDHQSPIHSSSTFESNLSFPNPMPQTIQNLLNSDDQIFTLDPFFPQLRTQLGRKNKPFIIIKSKKSPSRKSSIENIEVKIESEDKLATRTKRIIKREKAKLRLKVKIEPDAASSTEDQGRMLSDSLSNFEGDGKAKRKMVQMIRNRISAQNSRDRKKAYLMQLEDNKCNLRSENIKLTEENSQLLKELKELEMAQKKLQKENESLKNNKEKVGTDCVQTNDTDFTSEDSEQEFCEESLSSLLNSLNRPGFHKFALANKKNNKRGMGLATLVSLLVVLNLVQQGNVVVQGEEKDQDFDVSGIQKKILQEASEAVRNLQNDQKDLSSFSGWDLIQYLEPIIKKFGNKYRKQLEEPQRFKGKIEANPQHHLIKVEDVNNDVNGNNLVKSFFQDKFVMLEEDHIRNEESVDRKDTAASFFGQDSFETNERKDDIEEEGFHKFFGQEVPSHWNDEYKLRDIEYN